MALASQTLPVRVLLGVYLGVLTGVIPALVSWGLAVLFRYITGLTVPSFAVVVLGVAIAGVNGGFLAFNDPTIVQSQNNVTLVTAVLVVMMVSFYAHNMGDKLGAELPRRLSLRSLRERTLSADVVELVGGLGHVRVRVVGPVLDMEGYPPLPDDFRASLQDLTWTFPADVPLDDLERRFEERLRAEFDLADAAVRIDERARATVTAAPPALGLSRRIPQGERAVSVQAVVPTGVARGDEISVRAADGRVAGTVVAARTDGAGTASPASAAPSDGPPAEADGADDSTGERPAAPPRAPTTTGGEGRLTVSVAREDAERLLPVDRGRVVVTARGTRREYELLSLLRRAGQRIERRTVRAGGPLAGTTIGEADVRERYGVAVLAVRQEGRWLFAPRGDVPLSAGQELFVAGARDAIDRLAAEAVE